VYDTFAVANFYNRTDSDSRYVNIDGDTMTGALAGTTATFSGIIKTDDTTDATSTTDGSLQTDGGLSVVKKSVFGDDVTIISGSSPEIKIAPSDATAAFFKGDSNRSSAGQHLTEFQGYWNGTQVARIVVAAGDDTTNKDDGHLDFYTTPSGGSSTRAMRIKSDGNVGIGTSSPTADLSIVDSSTGTGIEIQPEIATGENRITNYDRVESAYKKFRLDASEHNFYISGSNKVTIDSSGDVGIGIDSPDDKLHIKNASGNTALRIESDGSNSMAFIRFLNDARTYSMGVDTDDSFFIFDSTDSKSRMKNTSTDTIFNEDSADIDFRIESDGNADMFFLDGGNNRVSIGGVNTLFNATATVTRNDTASLGDFEGNLMLFDNSSSSTATNGGHLLFSGHDGTSVRGYAKIIGGKGNSTSGQYDGALFFKVRDHGDSSITEKLRIKSGETTFNEISANQDFRIESDGDANAIFVDASDDFIGFFKNNGTSTNVGFNIFSNGKILATRDQGQCAAFVRTTNDGTIVELQQDSTVEGTISVSGSTISYNGFSGTHETSGVPDNTDVGTVCSTIDELDTYATGTDKADKTRADHAKIKVSDTKGDKRVYGVLQRYDDNGKPLVASVGIGSIKVTGSCEGGDLLESNGDGTAKVQSDDIIRSKTIGKVTIGNSGTGVKLVSCVLYCG